MTRVVFEHWGCRVGTRELLPAERNVIWPSRLGILDPVSARFAPHAKCPSQQRPRKMEKEAVVIVVEPRSKAEYLKRDGPVPPHFLQLFQSGDSVPPQPNLGRQQFGTDSALLVEIPLAQRSERSLS